jgi:hypothetical protein
MAKYIVTSPDGQKYEVTAPDDATPEQVKQYAQQNYGKDQSLPAKQPTVAEGMTTGERFITGIGKGMTDIYRGGKQLLNVGDQEALLRDIEESRRLDIPLLNTTSGAIGNFVGQASIAAPTAFIPGANTLAGATLLGGGLGAVQPTLSQGENAANVLFGMAGGAAGKKTADLMGGLLRGNTVNLNASSSGGTAGASSTASGGATAIGKGGGYTFGTVGSDPSAGLNEARRQAMESGKKLGMKLTPGQASGSKALQQLEAKLESQPMTSGPFSAIKANNQTILNRAAAQAIGESENVVDSAVLAQANNRISNVYKFVADQRPRKIDPDEFINRLANVENDFEGLLPGSVLDNPLVKRLYGFAERGNATGEQLQDIASKLGKAAHNQMSTASGDRQLGMALYQVKDQADDLLSQGLKGETKATFDAARSQYRNLMNLTQRTGVLNPSSGDVSGASLANLLQQKDKAGFLYGKNQTPMYEAARFAQAFKPIVGDSGTATRSPLPSPTDFVLSLPFNLMTRAYTSSPVVNASAAMSRGVAPEMGRKIDPYLRYIGGLSGGLLGVNASK